MSSEVKGAGVATSQTSDRVGEPTDPQARPVGHHRVEPSVLRPRLVAAAHASGHRVLDSGRGQPNWSATVPRAAFFRFGQFAVADSAAHGTSDLWGELPSVTGIHRRLLDDLASDPSRQSGQSSAATEFIVEAVDYAVRELDYDPDRWVHELVTAVLGAAYPSPTRFLAHLENVVERYLVAMTGSDEGPPDRYELFATEGGAAAMAYVFKTLQANQLVGPGDAIAISTPVFTPYLQIPALESYGFTVVPLQSTHNLLHRCDDGFLEQLLDPRIKVFFLINPGIPDTRAIGPGKLHQLRDFVLERRPELVVVADTAYATFVDGFRGVIADLPRNTILIHSFSKGFGATGNRLGFVAVATDNVLDDRLRAQPETTKELQRIRYSSVTGDVSRLSFMGRMVAESREVALHDLAGLSTVEQVQMAFFALAYLLPSVHPYITGTRAELARRTEAFFGRLGLSPPGGQDSLYYAPVDLLQVARQHHGDALADWLRGNIAPEDVSMRLAAGHGVIVQPGAMFQAESWDVRASLASLEADDLRAIGAAIVLVLADYETERLAAS